MADDFTFYLGTDDAFWLWNRPPASHLFVSHRRLVRYRTLRPAQTRWSLDSGGFTELNLYGEWRTTVSEYVAAIQRYSDEIGNLDWAAPQDWMCEPQVLAKTGRSVADHQTLTCRNLLDLRSHDATLPIIPVLQGWQADDYLRHIDMYERLGISLHNEPVVGMGTFCRRASLEPVQRLVERLANDGLKMHGFGVKRDGLPILGHYLVSADSMAWSFTARRASHHLCGQQHRAMKCSHCREWAAMWRARTVAAIGTDSHQMELALI